MKIPALVTGYSQKLTAGLFSDGRQEIKALQERDKEK
jgi:hypothetical protein